MSNFRGCKRWFLGALAAILFSGMAWASALNVNSADAAALAGLNGIGPSKAEAIVAFREANGPFKRLEDLALVKGIGPKLVEKLKSQISLDGK